MHAYVEITYKGLETGKSTLYICVLISAFSMKAVFFTLTRPCLQWDLPALTSRLSTYTTLPEASS